MNRSRNRRLAIKRETLRRLASGDLAEVAGGAVALRCTKDWSGCAGGANGNTTRCTDTKECPPPSP